MAFSSGGAQGAGCMDPELNVGVKGTFAPPSLLGLQTGAHGVGLLPLLGPYRVGAK